MQINKVLISDDLDACCQAKLQAAGIQVTTSTKLSKEQLLQEIGQYDGLIVRSATKVTADVINAGTNLKVIGRAGTGVDNIDVPAATAKNVLVANTPAANSISACEHTCALIMSMARHIPQAHGTMREGKWERKRFQGIEVYGKTLAIIGLGRIGREVGLRMQAFGMRTIGFDPLVSKEEAAKFNIEWLSLDEIWPQADFITVHVPLIPQTRDLVGAASLAKCKRGVRVVNCARGGVVSEKDTLAAIASGQCAGLALDVFEEEPPKNADLLANDKVILTPHLGASTEEAQIRVAEEIADEFIALKKGEKIDGAVNKVATS